MKAYARPGIGLILALPALRTVLPGDLGQESGAYQSARTSGCTLGGRLPEPPHDDLPGAVDLLVDLPTGAHQAIDVLLVFANVDVLADHRLALARPTGPQLARRERAADLRPQRWSSLRIGWCRRSLDAFIDRVALCGQAWPRRRRGQGLTGAWHVPPAVAAEDCGILDLLGAVGASAHGRKASAHRVSASGATSRREGSRRTARRCRGIRRGRHGRWPGGPRRRKEAAS